MLSLRKAEAEDCSTILRIQTKAFAPLVHSYHVRGSNPASESVADIRRRFAQPFTDYYLVCLDQDPIGIIRICDFGEECRVAPICILPQYQGRGYARQAMLRAEELYPDAAAWSLETILQEERLCRLYESLGYVRTERIERIRDGMDLVYYRKEVSNRA